jgi:hypothetical protein
LPDIFSYELVRAFGLPGCVVCRALAADERRWMDSFWREGKQDPATRIRFYDAGGFCREHAWLLHGLLARAGSGAAIADLYGHLADHDLRRLESIRMDLGRRRQRVPSLRRPRACPACTFRDEALERKAHFLVEALGEDEVREAYSRSEGLCFPHFAHTFEAALATGSEQMAAYLIGDWSDRLTELRAQLADYDRKRDHRHAAETKGAEQQSWTEIISRYVGGTQVPPRR